MTQSPDIRAPSSPLRTRAVGDPPVDHRGRRGRRPGSTSPSRQSPVQLPEPVAELARVVTANRKGHASIGALTPSPWLFPGGQPGRPISTTQLTQRLNNLGIHTDVAVTWQRLSAGDWATYTAEVTQRQGS